MTDSYEIERKFLVNTAAMPKKLNDYVHHELVQGYLCTLPVVRVRKNDDTYILTYKSTGMMKRKEVEMPLDEESFNHLISKADGTIIAKTRYIIPDGRHTIELDIFHGPLEGFIMAEVEFSSEKDALSYRRPDWFSSEVTSNPAYHNSNMSRMSNKEREHFLQMAKQEGL